MTTDTTRWRVGDCMITSVVEDEIAHIPPEFFFPEATAPDVAAEDWLGSDQIDADGNIVLRVQALVVDQPGRRLLIDPCVGNGKHLPLPFWNEQEWPFMERFADAGFTPESVDTVVHTHLHSDHVGWDTTAVGDAWVPTFRNARHLYTQRDLDSCRAEENPGVAGAYIESVAPVLQAGLADIVEEDADLGGGIRLEPTTGHTPGHVSLWLESEDETLLVTGDFIHHPVQCARPGWAEIGDAEAEDARVTRRRMLTRAAELECLVIGTHFPGRPAGRVVAHGDVWQFVPV